MPEYYLSPKAIYRLPAPAGKRYVVRLSDDGGETFSSFSASTFVENSAASSGGITWASEPANSSSSGNAGDVAYGGLYFYVHNGTQWNRVLLSSFGDSGGGGGGGGNVTTYRLLTEGSDTLLSEGGDYLGHDGNGTTTSAISFSQQPQNTTVVAGTDATFSATLEPAQNWYIYDMKWERAASGSPNSWSVVETESLTGYDILSSSNVTQNYTWTSASSFDDGGLFRATGSAFEYGVVHTAGALANKYAIAQGEVQYGLTVSDTYFSVTQGGTIQAQYLSTGATGSSVTYNLSINSVAADSGVTAFTNGVQPSGATHAVNPGDQIRITFSLDSYNAVPGVTLLFTPAAGIQTATATSAPATLTVT